MYAFGKKTRNMNIRVVLRNRLFRNISMFYVLLNKFWVLFRLFCLSLILNLYFCLFHLISFCLFKFCFVCFVWSVLFCLFCLIIFVLFSLFCRNFLLISSYLKHHKMDFLTILNIKNLKIIHESWSRNPGDSSLDSWTEKMKKK